MHTETHIHKKGKEKFSPTFHLTLWNSCQETSKKWIFTLIWILSIFTLNKMHKLLSSYLNFLNVYSVFTFEEVQNFNYIAEVA